MTLKLNVPSIVCQGCADTITEAITTVDDQAHVDVSIDAKTVTIESEAAEESFKEAIVATGHTVD